MSRLNSRGEALWGVGGGAGRHFVLLSLDGSGNTIDIGTEIGAAIAAKLGLPASGWEGGNGWFWKDDDTVCGQFCGDPTSPTGCSCWEWHLPSKTLRGPFLQGANNGKGRGGSWAFHLVGPAPGYHADELYMGVTTSGNYHSRNGALGDVFANGNVLLIKDYQQQTLGMEIINRIGAKIQDVPTVGQIGGVFCRGNTALWFDFGDRQLHALGAPNPVSLPNVTDHTGPFAADVTGRLWISDGQNGVLLRAWDTHVGYWLSRDEFSFFQDIATLPNGKLRLTAAMAPGEHAGSQRIWDIDPLTGAFVFNGVPGTAQLIDLQTSQPTSLPAAPAPAAVVHTNNTAATTLADNDDSTEMLVLVGALALLWYVYADA